MTGAGSTPAPTGSVNRDTLPDRRTEPRKVVAGLAHKIRCDPGEDGSACSSWPQAGLAYPSLTTGERVHRRAAVRPTSAAHAFDPGNPGQEEQ